MENRTYLVTEAEKLTGEKAHVLRYWEDELGMEIHRNSLGHRCYTAQDIQIFLGIRELKKKGLHLKAIRELMPKLVQATAEIKAFPAEAAETAKEKPDPAIPGKADEVPEVVVDLLPEREAEQLADTVMRQEEEERQTEFYRVLGRLLDQMTALSSALALIPLALRGDLPGNEIQSPMAKVILGGLLTSTFLNAFIVPIVYELMNRKKA